MECRQSSFYLFCAASPVSTFSTSTCDIGAALVAADAAAVGAAAFAGAAGAAAGAEPAAACFASDASADAVGAASFALAEPKMADLILSKIPMLSSFDQPKPPLTGSPLDRCWPAPD